MKRTIARSDYKAATADHSPRTLRQIRKDSMTENTTPPESAPPVILSESRPVRRSAGLSDHDMTMARQQLAEYLRKQRS